MHKLVLSTQEFGVAFGSRIILADVNLSIEKNSVTALVGPVGTGKSTLLRSLAGLNNPNPRYKSWGQVEYNNAPISEFNLPPLVQQHAKVMQQSALEALTNPVRRSLSLSPPNLRQWACDFIDAHEIPQLKNVLDVTLLDASPVEQRAIALLAGIAPKPALLMVDEPTANMSENEAKTILKLIRKMAETSAILVVLHNQKHMQAVASNIVLLAGGRIQEDANVNAFFKSPQSSPAQQFVKTGSCSVPAPDATIETLAEGVALPPPLPLAAQQAIAAAKVCEPEEIVVKPVTPENAEPVPQGTFSQIPPAPNKPKATGIGPRGFLWVVPGKLAGTPLPGVVASIDYDLKALKLAGITMLITLTERDLDQKILAQHGMKNLHLPIFDRESPSIAQISMLLARMQILLKNGEVLAVHCLAGIGRTGTVLAAWLIREGLTASEALKRVRLVDPKYVQSRDQEEFLQLYEDHILKKII